MIKKLLTLVALFALFSGQASAQSIYIAENGSDTNDGTVDAPMATLQAAIDKIEGNTAGKSIIFKEGTYLFSSEIKLTSAHSGQASNPLTIKASTGEKVVFTGGSEIDASTFFLLKNDNYLSRLPSVARGKVYVAPIPDEQIKYFYDKIDDYNKTAYLCFDGFLMSPAQFPNKGYAYISSIIDEGPQEDDDIPYSYDDPSGAEFKIRENINWEMLGEEFDRNKDMIIEGYLHNDWYFQRERVGAINASSKVIKLLRWTGYGVSDHLALPRRLRIVNALSQLDSPGEWYFDRTEKLLYFWPIEKPSSEKSIYILSEKVGSFLSGSIDHLSIEGITLDGFNEGINIANSDYISITGCDFKNFSHLAIRMNGVHNTVQSCNFSEVMGSVVMSGYSDNQKNLIPEHNSIINCEFKRSHYRGYGNVVIRGVAFHFAHNMLHNMNAGMLVYGNDHIVEYNEYCNSGYEMGDWNPIYVNNDMSARGNIFRYNFFHHIFATPKAHSIFALRTDDWGSGFNLKNNILYKCGHGAGQWEGPENSITGNVMMNSPYLWYTKQNPYGLTDKSDWATKTQVLQELWDEYQQLKADIESGVVSFNVKHNKIGKAELIFGEEGWLYNETWREHYPNLANTFIFDDPDRNPWMSVYNDVSKNYVSGANGFPFHFHGYNTINNYDDARLMTPKTTIFEMPQVINPEDLFENPAQMDFRFKTSFSPVEGFEKWDFTEVGLYIDEWRTDISVKEENRQALLKKYAGIPSSGGTFDYDQLNERYELPAYVEEYYERLTLGQTNIALNKPASQSSTYSTYSADLANDGNTDPELTNGSVSHTLQDENAWWEVDLENHCNITLIRLFNRNKYLDRFSDVNVFVSHKAFISNEIDSIRNQEGVTSFFVDGNIENPSLIIPEKLSGRYVRMQISGTNYLNIAEIEVYGSIDSGYTNSIETEYMPGFKIYPNPLSGTSLKISIEEIKEQMDIQIFDLLGREIYSQNISETQELEIPYSSFPGKGIYFIRMHAEEFNRIEKIIVK